MDNDGIAPSPIQQSASRRGRGGPRQNSGGPRQNSGGPRVGAGGGRYNAGGPRPGAGRPRTVFRTDTAPHDSGVAHDQVPPHDEIHGAHGDIPADEPVLEEGDGNVHDPLNFITVGAGVEIVDGNDGDDGDSENQEQNDGNGAGPQIIEPPNDVVDNQQVNNAPNQVVVADSVVMLDAAPPRPGIYPIVYAWDSAARAAREAADYMQPPPLGQCCSNCGETGHRRNYCMHPFYTMRITYCKFCGTMLLGKESAGVCCGKRADTRVSFRRPFLHAALSGIYGRRRFLRYSMHINKLFAFIHGSAELKWSVPNMPSMLCIQGVDSIAVPSPNASTSYLWSQGQPSLHPTHHSPFMHEAVQNPDVQIFVTVLHEHLRPSASISRALYRASFQIVQNNSQDQVSALNNPPTQEGHLSMINPLGPVLDSGIPSEMEAVTIMPTGIGHVQAPLYGSYEVAVQNNANSGNNPGPVYTYQKMYASSAIAEKGLYPILYPNDEQPWDLKTYELLRNSSGAGSHAPVTLVRDASGAQTTISTGGPLLRCPQGLTWMQHTKHRLYTDNLLLGFGPLLQMWLLRTCIAIEDRRLDYVAGQQKDRIASEEELQDALAHTENVLMGVGNAVNPESLGRLYLPASVTGTWGYWKRARLDCQALVSRFGPPSLFITVTMNAFRPEMERLGLDVVHRSSFTPVTNRPRVFDRPDLIARVWNQFQHEVFCEVTENADDYFGRQCIASCWRQEYQSRYIPHAHALIWLEGGVIDDPAAVDAMICAEMPREGTPGIEHAQDLQDARTSVRRFMTHKHSAYCKRNGVCRFGYDSTAIIPETILDAADNRCVYRRRHAEDMRVVPYNLLLLQRFRSHINVERTQSGGVLPYLFKYAFKPPSGTDVDVHSRTFPNDTAMNEGGAQPAPPRDEVREYRQARRIGATEAAWTLFEFRRVVFNPSVVALATHLPGQRVFILRNSRLPPHHETSSQLERYLARPPQYAHMKYVTYYEETQIYPQLPPSVAALHHPVPSDTGIPPRYVAPRNELSTRVARILWAPPAAHEQFALRRILLHAPISSFTEGRTWQGIEYSTFREAALARGLFAEGGEFATAMQEAVQSYATPHELRMMLFMCFLGGANPTILLNQFRAQLYADIVAPNPEAALHELLIRLHALSERHGGQLLRNFPGFPVPQDLFSQSEFEQANTEVMVASLPDGRTAAHIEYQRLNGSQRTSLDAILTAVRNRNDAGDIRLTDGRLFFLQGAAGTGKTFLLTTLRQMVQSDGMLCAITATTGIAASLYTGGRTLHSLLGLGVQESDTPGGSQHRASKYGPNSERAQLLRNLSVLIVDEASMLDRALFEVVDAVLKDLRSPATGPQGTVNPPQTRFAGLNIVLAGDYRQLLPVVPLSRRDPALPLHIPAPQVISIQSHILRHLPWASELWTDLTKLFLTEQFRQAEDHAFAELLTAVGDGLHPGTLPLPLRATRSVQEAYKWLSRWVHTNNRDHVDLDCMLVCATNSKVDSHLEAFLTLFPGQLIKMTGITEVIMVRGQSATGPNGQNAHAMLPEMANHVAPTGVPLHELEFKIGAPVMIIRNVLHPHLVNGRVLILKRFTQRCLFVALPDGSEQYALNRIDFLFNYNGVQVRRRQFPIRLAFASTVHKSQGRTLSRLVVDLRTAFFTPGQLYVALSRTRHAQDVLLLYELTEQENTGLSEPVIHDMPMLTKNPVLREAVDFSNGH
jgi:PIF1-like helicase/Helitron helicase-like domain at N-terminus